jgi:glycosyltransferase involved in cell wall biosynthesis
MRILLVSQMYPGASDPDFGTFVAQMEHALRARGHEIERAVLDRRGGGKRRFVGLRAQVRAAAPVDVVWAHFLVPTGYIAARGRKEPLVVVAHGQDVANVGRVPGIAWLTRKVVRRASTVIAVSDYLRRELEARIPDARGKTEVVDSGVDLSRFSPAGARAHDDGPRFLCVGSLIERKNVVRLADAFARVGRGTLTFVGDGPLRGELEGRANVHVLGRVPHDEIPSHLAAADVLCAPSLVEPFGQAILEAMASGLSVVATRVGGPPEFVEPGAGALVDPLDVADIARGLEEAAALPSPNEAAVAAAAGHDVRLQAERVEAILARAARDRRA